ncbi:MAG: tetratricopeptide repeat protein [Hyphomicrobiales bacterium]|nr:tetratricopeptide repeat protein [Hyphomicrobiales bacterium]
MSIVTNSISSGQAFLKARNYNSAAKIADEILSSNPNDQEANYLKFDCFFEQKKYSEALEYSQIWLAKNAISPLAHFSLFCAFLKLGKNGKANEALEVLKSTLPYEKETIQIAEYLYFQQTGSITKSEKALSKFRKSAPGLDFSGHEGLLKYKKNHFIAAMEIYKQLIEKGFANYGDYRFYAFSAFRALRLRTARNAARDALKLEPSALFMRETIILSYLVLIPPFLFAHAIIAFGKLLAEKIGYWGIIVAATLVASYYHVYDNYLYNLFPEGFGLAFNSLAILYYLYLEFLYGKNWLAIKADKQRVSLDNY